MHVTRGESESAQRVESHTETVPFPQWSPGHSPGPLHRCTGRERKKHLRSLWKSNALRTRWPEKGSSSCPRMLFTVFTVNWGSERARITERPLPHGPGGRTSATEVWTGPLQASGRSCSRPHPTFTVTWASPCVCLCLYPSSLFL